MVWLALYSSTVICSRELILQLLQFVELAHTTQSSLTFFALLTINRPILLTNTAALINQ